MDKRSAKKADKKRQGSPKSGTPSQNGKKASPQKKPAPVKAAGNKPVSAGSNGSKTPGGKKTTKGGLFAKKAPKSKLSDKRPAGIAGKKTSDVKTPPNEAQNRTAVPANQTKPVNKRSGKAVSKAMRNKQSAVKRMRYHGGSYVLYYILAGIVIITVFAILANTVLFKCKSITVAGNLRYSAEEIISSSGIAEGSNLLHINSAGAAEKIVETLAYVDSAKVNRSFPNGVEISVVEAQRWFSVKQGSVTAAVSHGGKIVEHGVFDDLPLVVGMEPENIEVGARLKSYVEGKNNIPSEIFSAAEEASLEKICELDITDRFSIKMNIDSGRIILELGTVSDMESKLKIASELIKSEISPTESVTVLLNNSTKVTIRSNHPEVSEPSEPSGTNEPSNPSEPQ